jgi:hypothetical protein
MNATVVHKKTAKYLFFLFVLTKSFYFVKKMLAHSGKHVKLLEGS